MAAKKILILSTLLTILGIGAFLFSQQNKPAPAEVLKAEQEVYSFLLQDQKNAYSDETDQIQLVEHTNSGELQGYAPIDHAGIYGSFNEDEFPTLQRKTWMDYQKKNKVSYPIKDYLPSSAEVIFVNPASGKQLYWWVSFSRIGFNSSLTQALVLVGDCRGEACYDSAGIYMYSMGDYVFLQKKNREWTIQGRQRVWFTEAPSP
jgi:hypothetical protein